MEDFSNIKLVIGIGNPDKKHEATYHNAGILVLEQLTEGCSWKSYKHFSYCKIEDLTIAISETFMNDSGLAVKEAMDFFKLKPNEILITHDDSDSIIGSSKFAYKGRSGGHKGIESIIEHIKTEDFNRFKIGIRHPKDDGPGRRKSEEFVLKKISKEDLTKIYDLTKSLATKLKLKSILSPT